MKEGCSIARHFQNGDEIWPNAIARIKFYKLTTGIDPIKQRKFIVGVYKLVSLHLCIDKSQTSPVN